MVLREAQRKKALPGIEHKSMNTIENRNTRRKGDRTKRRNGQEKQELRGLLTAPRLCSIEMSHPHQPCSGALTHTLFDRDALDPQQLRSRASVSAAFKWPIAPGGNEISKHVAQLSSWSDSSGLIGAREREVNRDRDRLESGGDVGSDAA